MHFCPILEIYVYVDHVIGCFRKKSIAHNFNYFMFSDLKHTMRWYGRLTQSPVLYKKSPVVRKRMKYATDRTRSTTMAVNNMYTRVQNETENLHNTHYILVLYFKSLRYAFLVKHDTSLATYLQGHSCNLHVVGACGLNYVVIYAQWWSVSDIRYRAPISPCSVWTLIGNGNYGKSKLIPSWLFPSQTKSIKNKIHEYLLVFENSNFKTFPPSPSARSETIGMRTIAITIFFLSLDRILLFCSSNYWIDNFSSPLWGCQNLDTCKPNTWLILID